MDSKLLVGFVLFAMFASSNDSLGADKINKRLAAAFDELRTPAAADTADEPESPKIEKATFGNGCFWCTEAVFENLNGVENVRSGYSGGSVVNPTYKQVCTGRTGHAEVIQMDYDPAQISFEKLLEVFWTTHDPTTLNRQGPDVGTQYRSAVFYHTEEQRRLAEHYKEVLNEKKVFGKPVVTEITKFEEFYAAEDYHQNYFRNNLRQPYCQFMVRPKVEKVRLLFKEDLKGASSKRDKGDDPDAGSPGSENTKVIKTDAEWRKQLSREQYRVTRKGGTERAFANRYWKHKAKGTYHCICCDQPLFDSRTKYKSGTGWPSFYAPIEKEAIATEIDRSFFTVRTEVKCDRCDAHLGHVFPDGPRPTGLRYCMNSAALKFVKAEESGKETR